MSKHDIPSNKENNLRLSSLPRALAFVQSSLDSSDFRGDVAG